MKNLDPKGCASLVPPFDPPMVTKSSNIFNNTQSLLAYFSDQMPLDEQEEGPNKGKTPTSL